MELSANIGNNGPLDFIGDFVFQRSRREENIEVVKGIVDRCIDRFKETRKINPNKIIIYRNGISFGQFKNILQFDACLVRSTIDQLVGDECGLTIIAANKLQNIRLFKQRIDQRARAPDQNVEQGIVVDTSVVHPEFTEFFLNAHRTLQGTARVPKYTVLYNDAKFSIEQLESITYDLCFCHQIVYFPTSLPSPVYIANRYSERGRYMYNRHMAKHEGAPSYDELTHALSYVASNLQNHCRINA